MKKWVNIFVDFYDKEQFYVSKSYATKKVAVSSVRDHMRTRYVDTINVLAIIKPTQVIKLLKKKA